MTIQAQQIEKSILFLIPFELDSLQELNEKKIKKEDDVLAFPSFKMIGFWEGARMAIEDVNMPNVKFNIIVRDVGLDEDKLVEVLNEFADAPIDLIIGPFYAKPFAIAAEYAKKRKIPILNPFSTRTDFLDSNAYVYKLMPAPEKQPDILYELFIQKKKNVNIVLWTNGSENMPLLDSYKHFFIQKKLPFQEVALNDGLVGLKKKITPNATNLLLAFHENNAAIISHLQSLTLSGDTSITMLAPMSWIDFQNIDFTFFESLHLHFFANYFVNPLHDKTELFIFDYIAKYNAMPTLERFSFQGYDITRYFMEMVVNDFDSTNILFEPLSFDFNFIKDEINGSENIKSRLISFQNYEFVEVK